MSRYIDAKWLEDNAKEYSLGYYESDEWATPLNVLDSAPSIDICFCRECKWYNCGACFRDDGTNNGRKPDDFCSYGCRSEKPNNSTISKMEQVGKE